MVGNGRGSPIADRPPLWNVMQMPGRLILTLSAAFLFLAGGSALFAPEELALAFDPASSRSMPIAVQLIGSGFLGFAILNWMSRGNRIGGIYSRPLALGNLMLFMTAALSLGKAAGAKAVPAAGVGLCAVFAVLAASFAWLIFAHDPTRAEAANNAS